MKPIVVATDFSEDARNAALRAALLAQQHGAKALLVHVAPELPLAAELALRASGAIERALSALAGELERESGVRFAPRPRMRGCSWSARAASTRCATSPWARPPSAWCA